MSYSNSIDYQASIQAEIFEKASLINVPSFYFARKFMFSKYASMLDEDKFVVSNLTTMDVVSKTTIDFIGKKGTKCPPLTMHWIGYIYRCLQNKTKIISSSLFKKVTFSYLVSVYPAYHTLSNEKAVDLIIKDCKIETLSSSEKIRRILKLIR